MSENKREEKKDRSKRVSFAVVISSFTLLFLLGVVIVSGFSCWNHDNYLAKKVAAIMPLPAIVIDNTNFISLNNLNNDLQSVRSFYEKQDFSEDGIRIDFSTEDGKKRLKIREKAIINRLIADRIIEKAAQEKGVFISDADVDQNVDRKIKEYGGEERIKDNLKNLYGWNLDDFKKKVVKPSLYQDEIKKFIQGEYKQEEDKKQKEKIQEAQNKLKAGEDFIVVAKNFSAGETAQEGGELGWFSREQIIDELARETFALREGEVSNIIESELGYHLIKMEEKRTENETEMVRVRQIFQPKATLETWLNEEIKKHKIWIFIDGYNWNSSTGIAEFADDALRDFEKKNKLN